MLGLKQDVEVLLRNMVSDWVPLRLCGIYSRCDILKSFNPRVTEICVLEERSVTALAVQ